MSTETKAAIKNETPVSVLGVFVGWVYEREGWGWFAVPATASRGSVGPFDTEQQAREGLGDRVREYGGGVRRVNARTNDYYGLVVEVVQDEPFAITGYRHGAEIRVSYLTGDSPVNTSFTAIVARIEGDEVEVSASSMNTTLVEAEARAEAVLLAVRLADDFIAGVPLV